MNKLFKIAAILICLGIPNISLAKNLEKIIMENTKFGMQVALTAQKGRGGELAIIMLKASELVTSMSGCHAYIVQLSVKDENRILITEVWESQATHQASLANPDVLALVSQAKPLITDMQHEIGKPLGN